MAGQLTIGGLLTGLPMGSINLPPITISANAAGNLTSTSITLASGFNSITVPSWAVGCLIIPNVTNAVGMTLKGVTGDTGIPLDLTGPSLINFPASPPATIGLTSAGAGATITDVVFF